MQTEQSTNKSPINTTLVIRRRRALRGFWLHNSAYCCGPDPQALSSVTSVAASHSRDCLWPPPDRERLCSQGPLMVMSSLCCWEWRALPRSLLKAQIRSAYATATGGGDAGEREAVGTIRESFGPLKKDSTIYQRLAMAAPSPLRHHGACPPPWMDPAEPLIRWSRRPHTVGDASTGLLLLSAFAPIKTGKRQCRESGCERRGGKGESGRVNSCLCVGDGPCET